MGTRSTITVKTGNTYTGIYCHWDGYPSGVGAKLFNHYNTQARAEALVALGSLSRLRENATKPAGHSFNNPVEGYTVAYTRDRGDEMLQTTGKTWAAVKHEFDSAYDYLFEGGVWFVSGPGIRKIPMSRFIVGTEFQDTYKK